MKNQAVAPNPLSRIRHLDYTVIYARDMAAMRSFYERVMAFSAGNVLEIYADI